LGGSVVLVNIIISYGDISLVDEFTITSLLYRPVHGLIFLFKWVPDKEPDGSLVQDSRLEKIFFAKQVHLVKVILLPDPTLSGLLP
jgi:hypothetical protein